jgi:hypothetical protein
MPTSTTNSTKKCNGTTQLLCYIEVTGTATHADDETLPGQYLVELTLLRYVSVSLLTAAELAEIARHALDCFHDHQGIEVLDDFEITATLGNGLPITQDSPENIQPLVRFANHAGKVLFLRPCP